MSERDSFEDQASAKPASFVVLVSGLMLDCFEDAASFAPPHYVAGGTGTVRLSNGVEIEVAASELDKFRLGQAITVRYHQQITMRPGYVAAVENAAKGGNQP